MISKASKLLILERLNYYRQQFASAKCLHDQAHRNLLLILDPYFLQKLTDLNALKASYTHRTQLTKHAKKFKALIKSYEAPFNSPYDALATFDISNPTHSGPISRTIPTLPSSDTSKLVINLSDQPLTTTESEVLALGLKFSPKPTNDPTADLASRIQALAKKLPPPIEYSVTHDVVNILNTFTPRKDTTADNLTTDQRSALKSLKQKSKDGLKFLPADKGNATVVLTTDQYLDKVHNHLDNPAYSIMKKEPPNLSSKLDYLLNRYVKEGKIDAATRKSMRVLHPRYPQLYGQPKIHKPNAPIRPIVSFYNTPLSAIHKVLPSYLKPLAQNRLRLKDSQHFKQRLTDPEFQNDEYTYLASLDVKALYTNCDMRKATDTAVAQFRSKPHLLPPFPKHLP